MLRRKKFPSTYLDSSKWSKNYIDVRKNNRRKRKLVTYNGRDSGKMSDSPKWLKPSP